MCGRFIFFADDDEERIQALIEESVPGLSGIDKINFKRGEVFPSQNFSVIAESKKHPDVIDMLWGYPPVSKKSSRLLINARAETAEKKFTFSDDFYRRRCLIPATGFYEWNKDKERFLFSDKAGLMFLGGLYQDDRFVILTRSPDSIVRPVHNRMPVLVPFDRTLGWLEDVDEAKNIISEYPIELTRFQQSFARQ